MGQKSALRSGFAVRRVERSDGTGRQGWNPQRNAATQVQTEAWGAATSARFGDWNGQGRAGVRDAHCLWKEPKCALVVAGKIEAAFAVLVITRLHGRIFLSQRFQAEAFP